MQAPRSALVCGATCGMHVFAGFVDKFFGHFIPEIGYGARQSGSRNLYKMLPIYSSCICHKTFNPPRLADMYNLTKSLTAKSLTGTLQRIRSTPETQLCKVWLKTWIRFYCDGKCPLWWHMMSEKQLSILTQGRNYARGNRQIIRIPRAFTCISAGAPWLWRSSYANWQSFPGTRTTAHANSDISRNLFSHWKFIVCRGWFWSHQ